MFPATMRQFLGCTLSGMAIFLSATSATAQIDKAFSGFNAVNVFATCWDGLGSLNMSACGKGQSGFGVELVVALSARDDATQISPLELGIGYSQFTEVRLDGAEYQIRGSVREVPALTVYYTFLGHERIFPYLGLRAGMLALQDVQAFAPLAAPNDTSGLYYTAKAQTFQAGGVAGLSIGNKTVQLNLETALMRRDFPNLEWAAKDNRLRSDLPRRLDVSGLSASLGLQVRFGKPAP